MKWEDWTPTLGAGALAATLIGTSGLAGEQLSQVFLLLAASVALALCRSPRRE